VNGLVILLVGGLVAVGLWSWLARRHRPRRRRRQGVDPLRRRSAREITEAREALEAEDLEQLLQATNARRRARGLPERTDDDVRRELASGAGTRSRG